MLQTLNDILTIAKNRNGVEAVSSPVSLAKIVRTTKASLGRMAQTKQIVIEVKEGILLPSKIQAAPSLTGQTWSSIVCMSDEVRLSQICNNLVSNAIKFTPIGGNVFLRSHVMPSSILHDIFYSSMFKVVTIRCYQYMF
jgi:signal transduction histidine kinase